MTAEVSDGVNPAIGTTKPTKLVIDTVAPPAPAITPVASGIQWPFTLNGTWVEDGATTLTAKLANQTWTLGKDGDLKSDGKGNWSFAPVVDLRPGTYDVTLKPAMRPETFRNPCSRRQLSFRNSRLLRQFRSQPPFQPPLKRLWRHRRSSPPPSWRPGRRLREPGLKEQPVDFPFHWRAGPMFWAPMRAFLPMAPEIGNSNPNRC